MGTYNSTKRDVVSKESSYPSQAQSRWASSGARNTPLSKLSCTMDACMHPRETGGCSVLEANGTGPTRGTFSFGRLQIIPGGSEPLTSGIENFDEKITSSKS
eukprot:gb/GECG01014384.1/.p1 GENE.gb/GECG01014384.1/~~gb/GECG01014384.1/.p1  ORF type:complete len:102 (+),score=6.12 gb/GECG01014384.1/:1-306(+)